MVKDATRVNSNETSAIPVNFTELETSVAAATLILIMMVTIIGNSTICAVIIRNKRLWTEMNMFLLNLAIGDIALCLSMAFSLVTALKREWSDNPAVCIFNGLLTSTLLTNTIFTHTLISIDRYFAIAKPMKKFMTRKKAALMITGGWVASLAVAVAPVFGWGGYHYNGSTLQCGPRFPETTSDSLYILFIALVGFILPIAIMSCAYTRIYKAMKRHSRRMSTTIAGQTARTAMELKRKVAVTFFLAVLGFMLCWTPFFVFIVVAVVQYSTQVGGGIPHGLGIAAYWCGYLNCACNPFIVGLRSQTFRSAFHNLFCWPCLVYRRHQPRETRV